MYGSQVLYYNAPPHTHTTLYRQYCCTAHEHNQSCHSTLYHQYCCTAHEHNQSCQTYPVRVGKRLPRLLPKHT